MAKTERNPTTIEGFLHRFQKTRDRAERREIVEKIATRFKRKAATKALMDLLSNEPVMKDTSGRIEWVVSDAWRTKAYDLLSETPLTRAEVFSFVCRVFEEDRNSDRRNEAMAVLHRQFADYPETLGFMMRVVDDYSIGPGRMNVLWYISRHFGHRPESFPYLIRAAAWPGNGQLSVRAIEALAEHHAQNPETRSLLENLAGPAWEQYTDPRDLDALSLAPRKRPVEVRTAAIQAVRSAYSDHREAYEFLVQQVRLAKSSEAAGAAFNSLLKEHRNQPDAIPFVIEHVRSCTDQAALTALVTYGRHDSRVLPFLHDRLKTGKSDWERWTAIKGLATGYADDRDVEDLIIRYTTSDRCNVVRDCAIRMLGMYFQHSTRAMYQLIELARNEPHELLRRVACNTLFFGFGKKPEALEALTQLGYQSSGDPEQDRLDVIVLSPFDT